MEKVLFLAHAEPDGRLGRAALEALTAACALARAAEPAALVVGLVGPGAETVAAGLGSSGATRGFVVAGEEFAQSRYATDAVAAEAICRASGATLIVAPGTSRWARTLPGVAYRVSGRVDTHVTAAALRDGVVGIKRWYYRQRIEAAVERVARPWLLLVEPGCHKAWRGRPAMLTVESLTVDVPEAARRTMVSGTVTPAAGPETIRPDAPLLFVAGAGWTKRQADGRTHAEEAERLILEFLERTQASLGGSKLLVDLSGEGQAVLPFMTHLNQIGQTGSTPRHPKGLATCCHGEEPHVVGWRFVKERRAVNLDADCGWSRGKADVVYVGDAFEVMARVNARLSAQRGT